MTVWCLIPNIILYFLASFFYLAFPLGSVLNLKEGRKILFTEFAWVFTLFGLLLHALYIGYLFVQQQPALYLLLPFVLVLMFVIVAWKKGWQVLGAFFMPLVLLEMLVVFIRMPQHTLPWLGMVHGVLAALTSAFLAGNLILGIVLSIQQKNLKNKRWSRLFFYLPPLVSSERLAKIFMQIGFFLLTFVFISGVLLAETTTHFSPKIVHVLFAILSWAFYGYLLYRERQQSLNRTLLLVSSIGFLSLIATFFMTRGGG